MDQCHQHDGIHRISKTAMQIPHRNVVGFVAGVALGIGSTVVVLHLQEQRRPQPSKPQARPSPALTSPLLLKGEPALGNASALLTIVEFSDFECSYCRRFHEQVMPTQKRLHRHRTGSLCPQRSAIAVPPSRPARSRSRTMCWRTGPVLGLICRPV